jgi:DNA-binding NtrC family response regulator
VEAAEGGTLFLDEIGEMPLAMQAKMLRFLENRRYMRVGGSIKLQADVRLVFATLRALEDEVRAGRFRADLYYRVQGITVQVPPLRDRRADIPPMLVQFVGQLSARHGTRAPRLTRSARAALLSYDWPGNVRELRNVVETVCLLRPGKAVRLRDLPESIRRNGVHGSNPVEDSSLELSIDLAQSLERNIEKIIGATLVLEHGNRSHAAERLGVSVRTIQRYLARGVIEPAASSGDDP